MENLKKALDERLVKAKYLKRTGSPGNYKYIYKEGGGPKKKKEPLTYQGRTGLPEQTEEIKQSVLELEKREKSPVVKTRQVFDHFVFIFKNKNMYSITGDGTIRQTSAGGKPMQSDIEYEKIDSDESISLIYQNIEKNPIVKTRKVRDYYIAVFKSGNIYKIEKDGKYKQTLSKTTINNIDKGE